MKSHQYGCLNKTRTRFTQMGMVIQKGKRQQDLNLRQIKQNTVPPKLSSQSNFSILKSLTHLHVCSGNEPITAFKSQFCLHTL